MRMQMPNIFQNPLVAQGIGAGCGVVIPGILQKYKNEPIPIIGDYLGVFGKYPTFIPIASGVIAFAASFYRKLDVKVKGALAMYGVTATLAGIMIAVGEVQAFRAPVSLGKPANYVPYSKFDPGYISHQYYPDAKGVFFDRPRSMAKGWASDVTRNPMAAIPTTLPETEIIA